MEWQLLSKRFDHHMSQWLDELFGEQDSIVIDSSLEDGDFDDFFEVLKSIEQNHLAPITFLYHENGENFVEAYRGVVPEEKSIGSIHQAKLAIQYKKLKSIRYFKINSTDDSDDEYSFSVEITCPVDSDLYTSCRTNHTWKNLDDCKQQIHDILMVNPLSFVGVRDCTLEPTIEQRGIARVEKALEEPAVGAISQVRTVEYIGMETEIAPYLEKYRPVHQELVEGFPVNPTLRPDFDSTDNNERDPLEIEDWWGKPYIVTDEYWQADDSYSDYVERMSDPKVKDLISKVDTEEEFCKRMDDDKKSWFEHWPTGTRYEVRCLDGGAWDRSSSKGMFSSLELAIFVCNKIVESDSFLFCTREEDILPEFEAQASLK
ncbi:hypothetical protein AB835_08260 [Candidatus Endobugula sertula]|uniref:Uncharacterized protein n=1 Tax=Candidatus Endobugula sertula TaxID=62101 RepID=A0A1D2QPS4_9GAMM|nr:hypothetical protein AB835_08260 [Candidatus Endobugula sertula]